MVTATTLLPKLDAQVHDWAFRETSLGGRALLSSWLFWLLGCKLSLILPKCLYSVTLEWTERLLGLDDINLQTEEIHCNYSVLIGSPE